ncbi:MAG TPA: ATP-binding protein [Kofleriaceae bacterium]|jgi:signal transduction histidine kinase
MRTLSARILLGFAALTITFGALTVMIVNLMGQVEDEIVLIGKAYQPLAKWGNELDRSEADLHEYLEQELPDAPATAQQIIDALASVKKHRKDRDAALAQAKRVFADLDATVEVKRDRFARTRAGVDKVAAEVEPLKVAYDQVLGHANDKVAPGQPPSDALRAALDTLVSLRATEKQISVDIGGLRKDIESYMEKTTAVIIENERIVRMRAIYGGAAAVILGLLVTSWVVLTLRPLQRLREGARRVAAGDYASRIPEKGPTEVADLAREFNSMGHAIEERERELLRAERLATVGTMAASVAHEIRNPLSSIALNTELLADELPPGATEGKALVRAIHHEVDRLTAMTEEYLAFARLPKPKLAAEPINPMVQALAAFVREDLAARKVELATELGEGEPIAQADAGQLRQCLINLVRNAADAVAAKGGGHITLRTRTEDAQVRIEVEDDGVGIPPDILPKLFDPFFSTKDGGSGLGLALTQQIVRDHGGDVSVASTVGHGTVFTVRVPSMPS